MRTRKEKNTEEKKIKDLKKERITKTSKLSDDSNIKSLPRLSPNKDKLVYYSLTNDENGAIYKYDLKTNKNEKIITDKVTVIFLLICSDFICISIIS